MDGNTLHGSGRMWLQKIDRQLKEQFILGLNDKDMLGKIIKELITKNNNEQTTSEGVLVWAK